MKKKYKFIIWSIIPVVSLWYFIYFTGALENLEDSKRFNLLAYKNNSKALKTAIYFYYYDHEVVPKKLDKPLLIAYDRPEYCLYCYNSKAKLRLSNPTFKNILLFPVFPLRGEYTKKRIKYSYIYDKSKKSYIVTLESPFKDRPEFKSLTFEVPESLED